MSFDLKSPFIKMGKYQQEKENDISQCLTCERRCNVKKGEFGFCGTRLNISGSIYTIIYGYIPAISINPIEKKPFYHFYPGSYALTIGTYGCNFSCFWCQNHHLSHPKNPIEELVSKKDNFLNPEDLINTALARQCEGTSISFNEPTLLFEYSLKVFKLAKKKNLYNTYVSNGYMTEMVLKDLKEKGLDAINIDIKGNNEIVKKHCGIDNEKVWRNAELAKNLGIHVEITTLLIEGLNSDLRTIETIAKRIENNLGSDTPYHISRFFPKYKAKVKGYTKATSLNLLYKSYDIASKFLNFVYIGNIFDPKYNTTFCPNCLQKVITRSGLSVSEKRLDTQGNCSYCGTKICVQ